MDQTTKIQQKIQKYINHKLKLSINYVIIFLHLEDFMIFRAENFKDVEILDYESIKQKIIHGYIDEYNIFNHMSGLSGMLTSLAYGPTFKFRLQEISDVKKGEKDLSQVIDVYLALNKRDIISSKFDIIYEVAKVTSENGHKVIVCIDDDIKSLSNDMPVSYYYTNEEMKRLTRLNDMLVESGQEELIFNEFSSYEHEKDLKYYWTFRQVKLADEKLNKVVDYVKQNNYSPFEAFLFFHKFVTERFKYKEGGMESERVIVGAFNNEEINCAGFASMIKALVDKFDDQNLKCDIMPCEIRKKFKNEGGAHCQNLIYLKDKLYNIDGFYIEDASHDSKLDHSEDGLGYSYCLVPINDMKHLRKNFYIQEFRPDRFQSIFIDVQSFLKSKNIYSKSKTLFRLSKIYQAIKKEPQVISKYGKISEPIDITSYKKALTKIYFDALEDESKEFATIKSEEDILKSSVYSILDFKRKAENCFVKNAYEQLGGKKIKEYKKMDKQSKKGNQFEKEN